MEPKVVAEYTRRLEAQLAHDLLLASGFRPQIVSLDGLEVALNDDLYQHHEFGLAVPESEADRAEQLLLEIEDKVPGKIDPSGRKYFPMRDWAITANLDPNLYGLWEPIRQPWWKAPRVWLGWAGAGALLGVVILISRVL